MSDLSQVGIGSLIQELRSRINPEVYAVNKTLLDNLAYEIGCEEHAYNNPQDAA